jgi:hypothetical protein
MDDQLLLDDQLLMDDQMQMDVERRRRRMFLMFLQEEEESEQQKILAVVLQLYICICQVATLIGDYTIPEKRRKRGRCYAESLQKMADSMDKMTNTMIDFFRRDDERATDRMTMMQDFNDVSAKRLQLDKERLQIRKRRLQIRKQRLQVYQNQNPSDAHVISILTDLDLTRDQIFNTMTMLSSSDLKRQLVSLPASLRMGWLKYCMKM